MKESAAKNDYLPDLASQGPKLLRTSGTDVPPDEISETPGPCPAHPLVNPVSYLI